MSSSGSVNFGASGVRTLDIQETVVIHHLSDLHFGPDASNKDITKGRDAFFAYSEYLRTLKDPMRPEIIVITGDLTSTGSREELKAVALLIGNAFANWTSQFKKHIFIVPGPYDIDWEHDEPGFQAFQRAFAEYSIPSFADNTIGAPYVEETKQQYMVQLLDTCYGLEDLPKGIPNGLAKKIKQIPEEYKKLVSAYQKYIKKTPQKGRKDEAAAARDMLLKMIEETFVSLDTGMIRKGHIASFKQQMAIFNPKPLPDPNKSAEPLRILVTHHPLIAAKGNIAFDDNRSGNFSEIAQAARENHFHLALHGHLHEPQVLTDFSFIEPQATTNSQVSLRQLGAGSLGEAATFSEIIAMRSDLKPKWQLYVETKKLDVKPTRSVFSFSLLDPEESQRRYEAEQRESKELKTRQSFEDEMREVMRRFAISAAGQDEIPTSALVKVQQIIEDIIFEDIRVNVNLAIKTRTNPTVVQRTVAPTTPLYILNTKYIDTDSGPTGLHRFPYPLTIAAWALILGREISYIPLKQHVAEAEKTDKDAHGAAQPSDQEAQPVDNFLKKEDFTWLNLSGKISSVRESLAVQLKLAEDRQSTLSKEGTQDEIDRNSKLISRFKRMIDQFKNNQLVLSKAYQPPDNPDAMLPFISIPIPLRPDDNVTTPWVEVGVLNVDILPQEISGGITVKLGEAFDIKRIFTDERIAMLKSLSDLIFIILTEAAYRGRPAGTWL